MRTTEGFKQNEAFVIVNENNCVVDVNTFLNKRRKSYLYSQRDCPPNNESVFQTIEQAQRAAAKSKRPCSVKQLKFDSEDVSGMYSGEGANILSFDFVGERIWIESRDGAKYGYDYRTITMN